MMFSIEMPIPKYLQPKPQKLTSHPISTSLKICQGLLLNTVPKEPILTKQLPFGLADYNVRGKECLGGSYISN